MLSVILAIAVLWPVNSWILRRGGRPVAVGLATSLAGLALALGLAARTGGPLLDRLATPLGVLAGVGFGVGYCLIIFHCLKIGPAGPTATLNNLGLLWPVTIGLLFFDRGHVLSATLVAGLVATVSAIGLMAWSRPEGPGKTTSLPWLLWGLGGWAGSGLSGSSQYLAGQLAPGLGWTVILAMFGTATILLLAFGLYSRLGWPGGAEWLGGLANGLLLSGVIIRGTVVLSARMPPAVFFPITQAVPIILVLLAGRYLLRERLSAAGWAACLIGAAGVALLSAA